MAKTKPNNQEQVAQLIAGLAPTVREVVIYISQTLLAISPLISQHIKWNSVSFQYNGEMEPFDPKEYKRDILVCNVNREKILLVLPTGAKVKDNLGGKDYPDGRKIITIKDLADIKQKKEGLSEIISKWLLLVV